MSKQVTPKPVPDFCRGQVKGRAAVQFLAFVVAIFKGLQSLIFWPPVSLPIASSAEARSEVSEVLEVYVARNGRFDGGPRPSIGPFSL